MSLILDALRKMEQERRARQGAAQDLRPEVLRYRSRIKPRQTRPYLLVAGLLLVAAVVGAAAFQIGKRDAAVSEVAQAGASVPAPAYSPAPAPSEPAAAPSVPAAPSEQAAPATPAVPAVPAAPVPDKAVPAPEPPAAAVRPAPVKRLPAPVPSAPSVAAPAAPVPAANREAASRAAAGAGSETRDAAKPAAAKPARAEAPAPQQQRAQHREPAAVAQTAPADITISGIAYQDERHLRRAVINGILVGEGAEVAGARVVEIKEHKVRISRGGQFFDVPFSTGFQGR